jgi:hypothetical protein
MKKSNATKYYRLLFLFLIAVTLNRCALLELGELGEMGAMSDLATVSETEGLATGIVEAEALPAGEAALVENGATVVITDETALLKDLEKIEMRSGANGRSELFVRGKTNPFADVVDRKYIRLLRNGNRYATHNTIFRVTGDEVILRSSRGLSAGSRIVALRNGGFIEELYESDGWYWVKVSEDGSVWQGWIPVTEAIGLVLIGKDDKNLIAKEKEKKVVYKELINPYFINQPNSTEITVFIANAEGVYSITLSSGISKIYSETGYHANFSLFKPEFADTKGFEDLFSGNTDWAVKNNIQLNRYTDYIAIGKVKSSYKDGTITNGTRTCNSILEVHIYNTKSKSIQQAFTLDLNGIGFQDDEAKQTAEMHIFSRYKREHSNI